MTNHMVILAGVMLLAGVFGGLINYYQMSQRETDPESLPRCIVMGIGAAFLVPVVLHLISSDLVAEIQTNASGLLIYSGYCLIAAVASRLAMASLGERILREAAMARLQAESVQLELRRLQEELLPLIETETEVDVAETDAESLEAEVKLDVTSGKVLKSLGCGRYIFRSLKGVCQEAGLDEATATKTLAVLISSNLAGKINGSRGSRWFLTEKGRRVVDLIV